MELKKRKYKRAEVEKIISDVSADYQQKINELKQQVVDLFDENKKLSLQNQMHEEKSQQVVEALSQAQQRALEIENSAINKYNAVFNTLKNFLSKWRVYFDYIQEKYPFYTAVNQSVELKQKLSDVLTDKKTFSQNFDQVDQSLKINFKNAGLFDPEKNIQDYIATTGDNGFNLDEVLNPGELILEDLCKELGLLEENE